MATTETSISRPIPQTRVLTAIQWAMTTMLLYITLGSGVVLLVSELTSRSVLSILLWQPNLPLVMLVVAAGIGLIGGAYWPVVKRDSEQRERALLFPRYRCATYLSVVVFLILPVSLINVFTVTELVTNLFVFSGFLLVCIYAFVYDAERNREVRRRSPREGAGSNEP